MSQGQIWSLVIGTLFGMGVLVGVFLLKRYIRARLFPGSLRMERGRAMADLLALQARLREQAGDVPGEVGDGRPKKVGS